MISEKSWSPSIASLVTSIFIRFAALIKLAGEGFREIPQTGLECIGALDHVSVGEVVSLAAKSLMAISDEAVLSVSHIGVISGVLEAAGLDEAAQKAVFSAVGAKNVPAIKMLCDQDAAALLAALAELYGPLAETLKKAEALALPEKSRAALHALSARSLSSLQPTETSRFISIFPS